MYRNVPVEEVNSLIGIEQYRLEMITELVPSQYVVSSYQLESNLLWNSILYLLMLLLLLLGADQVTTTLPSVLEMLVVGVVT